MSSSRGRRQPGNMAGVKQKKRPMPKQDESPRKAVRSKAPRLEEVRTLAKFVTFVNNLAAILPHFFFIEDRTAQRQRRLSRRVISGKGLKYSQKEKSKKIILDSNFV